MSFYSVLIVLTIVFGDIYIAFGYSRIILAEKIGYALTGILLLFFGVSVTILIISYFRCMLTSSAVKGTLFICQCFFFNESKHKKLSWSNIPTLPYVTHRIKPHFPTTERKSGLTNIDLSNVDLFVWFFVCTFWVDNPPPMGFDTSKIPRCEKCNEYKPPRTHHCSIWYVTEIHMKSEYFFARNRICTFFVSKIINNNK